MRKEPLQLIQIDDYGRCHPQKEALDVIRNLPKGKKIGVVGVAGLYRTGKSFLLNRLMGLQKGFEIGNTVQACTKGLWMWGQPVEIGSDFMAILIDTEGLGSAQRTTDSDMKIFSLCILLSSLFVLNSMGAIDEMALESLNLVLNLSKNIQVKQSGNAGDDMRNLAQHFPSFHWVLRDFSLQPKDAQNNDIGAREYLENALAHDYNGNESKNKIRSAIRELFKQRDCTFLIRPVGDEKVLQNLANTPYESLREPFRRQMDALTKEIYTSLKPKGMGNSSITGPMLAQLCEVYCDAINKAAIPSIHGAWQAVVQEQLRKVSKQAASHYRKEMNEKALTRLPMAIDELRGFHKSMKKEAMEIFQVAFLEPVNEKQLQGVKPYIANLWAHAQTENNDASREFCAKLATESVEKAKTDPKKAEAVLAEFAKNSVGPHSHESFARTVVPKIISVVRASYDEQLSDVQTKATTARTDVLEARNALALQHNLLQNTTDDLVRKMKGELEAQQAQHKLEIEEMEDKHESSMCQVERERDQLESQKHALAEQVKMLQEKTASTMIRRSSNAPKAHGRRMCLSAKRESRQKPKDNSGCLNGLAESVSTALDRLRSLEVEKGELKQRNEHEKQLIGLERKFNQKLTEARRESEAKVESIRKEYEKEIENMREQNKNLQIKISQQDAELQKNDMELENVRVMEMGAVKQMRVLSLQRELVEAMLDNVKSGNAPETMDRLSLMLDKPDHS